jgi:hypothetical protein
MDRLGFRPVDCLRPGRSGRRFRSRLLRTDGARPLRLLPRVRCAGLFGTVSRPGAGLLRVPAFVLRERVGRVLPGEGPLEGFLVPGGFRRAEQLSLHGRRLADDTGRLRGGPADASGRWCRALRTRAARRACGGPAAAPADTGADERDLAAPMALERGRPRSVNRLRQNIGTKGRTGSRTSPHRTDISPRDLPGGRDIFCPVSG